jgi:penicillin-binding protein 2
MAKRTGMDRIAAMANRFGLGVDLDIELPGTRRGVVPTRGWRQAQGKPWNLGDTVVHGIGQGFYQLTPLSLCTMTARLASGRAIQPHLTRSVGGRPVRGGRAEDWPGLGIPDRDLRLVREAMWSVINEEGGTARLSRLPAGFGQMAGKTGTTQVRRVSREQRERGFRVETMPREWRPHALFVAFAPHDNPQYAISVVVEHGTSGSAAAAPLARDILVETFTRLRGGAQPVPSSRVSEMRPPTPPSPTARVTQAVAAPVTPPVPIQAPSVVTPAPGADAPPAPNRGVWPASWFGGNR